MDVSKNRGTPKSSILIGFSIIFTIHFGVPLFLETATWLVTQLDEQCPVDPVYLLKRGDEIKGILAAPPKATFPPINSRPY